MMLSKIVSGGQTGADRAALDAAQEMGIPHGGWCPRGRRAEDGPLPERYQLQETPSDEYPQRTEWNVRDSDGTLVMACGAMDRGTLLTLRIARRLGRLHTIIHLDRQPSLESTLQWISENGIRTLNVAGPRESSSPGCYSKARTFLLALLARASQERGSASSCDRF